MIWAIILLAVCVCILACLLAKVNKDLSVLAFAFRVRGTFNGIAYKEHKSKAAELEDRIECVQDTVVRLMIEQFAQDTKPAPQKACYQCGAPAEYEHFTAGMARCKKCYQKATAFYKNIKFPLDKSVWKQIEGNKSWNISTHEEADKSSDYSDDDALDAYEAEMERRIAREQEFPLDREDSFFD